jgi:hypothetical protein
LAILAILVTPETKDTDLEGDVADRTDPPTAVHG